MILEFPTQIFEKYSNNRFYANLSSGSQVIQFRSADMMQLMIAFHNFANVPNRRTTPNPTSLDTYLDILSDLEV
jgi:hypothetical protein